MSVTGLLLVSGRSVAARSLALAKSNLCSTLYVYLSPESESSSSSNPNNASALASLSQFTASVYLEGSKVCPDIDIRLLVRSLLPIPGYPQSRANLNSRPINCVIVQDQIPQPRLDQLLALFSLTQPMPSLQILPEESPQLCPSPPVQCQSEEQVQKLIPHWNSPEDVVALGGTFDRLHNGHRMLLSEAVLRCNKELIVGVTDDTMVQNKVLKELIEPTTIRMDNVRDFLGDIGPGLTHRVVAISDPFGPTIVEKAIDLIVVSEETIRGAEKINEIRTERGYPILQIHAIQTFQDHNPQSEHEDSKISSSSARLRILGKRFRPSLKPRCLPYVIGLTGGIASGKSKICAYLEEHAKIPIIDCDKLGHAAYKSGTPCFTKIVDTFGTDILLSNPECQSQELPEINRRLLGAKVFGQPDELKKLTDIVWPEIRRLALEQIKTFVHSGERIIILDAAVLLEAGWDDICHDIWVTFVPREEAIRRIQARDKLSVEDAERRIDAQLTNKDRIARATFVFCSLWEYEFTQEQVVKALRTVEQEIAEQI